MNIGVSVVGNSTSTGQIDYTVDDDRGLSEPDARLVRRHGVLDDQRFTSTPTYAAFTTPVAAFRLTMNAPSSAAAR
jgi:hypothetical protein